MRSLGRLLYLDGLVAVLVPAIDEVELRIEQLWVLLCMNPPVETANMTKPGERESMRLLSWVPFTTQNREVETYIFGARFAENSQ